MASNVGAEMSIGRSKHLGELAQVFRHRHASWVDFGRFLKHEFRGTSSTASIEGTSSLDSMPCRHNVGGRHHAILAASVSNLGSADVFGHERYSRPCVSHGAFDHGKNGGLVVHDLCVRAAAFLQSIGRGDPQEPSGRDFRYDTPLEPASVENSEGDPESQGSISSGNVLAHRLRTALERRPLNDDFDDLFFEDEDVIETLRGLVVEDPLVTVAETITTLSDLPSSQDSVLQLGKRGSSTKMRAATLGYLWGFADDPSRLRDEFRRLRGDASLCVLHLCGCGLCYRDASGRKVVGCCEHSHLALGTLELNGQHRTFHTMLSLAPVHLYPHQVAIIRESTGGGGIF